MSPILRLIIYSITCAFLCLTFNVTWSKTVGRSHLNFKHWLKKIKNVQSYRQARLRIVVSWHMLCCVFNFVCLRRVSCASNVASFSGLSSHHFFFDFSNVYLTWKYLGKYLLLEIQLQICISLVNIYSSIDNWSL